MHSLWKGSLGIEAHASGKIIAIRFPFLSFRLTSSFYVLLSSFFVLRDHAAPPPSPPPNLKVLGGCLLAWWRWGWSFIDVLKRDHACDRGFAEGREGGERSPKGLPAHQPSLAAVSFCLSKSSLADSYGVSSKVQRGTVTHAFISTRGTGFTNHKTRIKSVLPVAPWFPSFLLLLSTLVLLCRVHT